MADTTVDADVHGAVDFNNALWGPYWSSPTTAVIISHDSDVDVEFWRTTDSGASWTQTEVQAGTAENLAAWYDRETPGDTGTLVHIVWTESAGGAVHYRTIDVSDGTMGTLRTIVSATVDTNGSKNRVAITKSRNGNLYAAYSLQVGTTEDFVRSTDSGANWSSRAALGEGDQDWCLLFPANTGDDADIAALFWDVSADILSVKMHDDSGNTWTETNIDTAAIDDLIHANMDGSIRHSDGHLLIAYHNDDDATTDDLVTWDLTIDSIASPTITSKANIFTDQAESAQCSMFINQQNDDVYVAYLKGGTWLATTDVVYHKSTDGMGVWGTEEAYSEATADDNRVVQSGRTVGDDGGRYQPVWNNDDLLDIFVNEVNDVEIAAAAAPAATVPTLSLLGVGT